MRYEIVLAPEAVEDMERLSARWQAMVRDALEKHLRHQPTRVSRARIKKLRGLRRPQYRLRVDEIRVFYDIRERTVEVLAVVPKSLAGVWLQEMGESE
ncbi:MAG TPA: type II toxin-antitoxin system RelE/ParE family toxin [Verrucomicrobiae bacterium]|nr:type II toxin-antitoxin system RelE/ParE family toxin [Verrucomicrobiae bacterium]